MRPAKQNIAEEKKTNKTKGTEDCKVCKDCQLKIQEKQKLCITAQQDTKQCHRSATGHEANWAVC